MKRNIISSILTIVAIVCMWCYGYTKGYKAGQVDTLPSQSEVQEILGVPVDGVIGPKSREVWDELIEKRTCDEYAEPIMEQFNKDFNELYEN